MAYRKYLKEINPVSQSLLNEVKYSNFVTEFIQVKMDGEVAIPFK